MKKKRPYIKPLTETVSVEACNPLAGSGNNMIKMNKGSSDDDDWVESEDEIA